MASPTGPDLPPWKRSSSVSRSCTGCRPASAPKRCSTYPMWWPKPLAFPCHHTRHRSSRTPSCARLPHMVAPYVRSGRDSDVFPPAGGCVTAALVGSSVRLAWGTQHSRAVIEDNLRQFGLPVRAHSIDQVLHRIDEALGDSGRPSQLRIGAGVGEHPAGGCGRPGASAGMTVQRVRRPGLRASGLPARPQRRGRNRQGAGRGRLEPEEVSGSVPRSRRD